MDISQYKKAALPVACVFLFVFLLFIVFLKNGILDLNKKKVELKDAVAKNQELREENQGLYREVSRLKSDQEYLEQVARKELGMIKKDEIIVKFHSDSPSEGDSEKTPKIASETPSERAPETASEKTAAKPAVEKAGGKSPSATEGKAPETNTDGTRGQ